MADKASQVLSAHFFCAPDPGEHSRIVGPSRPLGAPVIFATVGPVSRVRENRQQNTFG